jgi:hypothetical protein
MLTYLKIATVGEVVRSAAEEKKLTGINKLMHQL